MKEKITEKSIRLFEEKGFSETSIQDIVDTLGVTKGTFYYYFSSKEELLMDIHLGYISEILSRQEQILGDESKSFKQKLFDIILMLISDIKIRGRAAKIFFREMKNLSPEHAALIVPKRDQFRLNTEELIQAGMKNGEFRPDLNASIVSFAILGIVNWSYQWFNPKGAYTDQEVSEIFVDMILKGIQLRG
ncbi:MULTISPECIES: TetR/AcrR family transcriptional regulator [Neobacillus]|uniref:TetR family transcriptional regulator n=1 Tax=Neobacillus rhizophilus TaxID=2833579 RepID=A0A942UF82_9BACI|nr:MULTISPECIES: TetR/AcrR family transcriptional regulator [Neobacillus]MBS4216129.1 TetR family transcriptional regulator [Neobacillus rhizophilus]MBU8919878.1 TetR/AcrR family transcriptional regulator [Bacillus sp. FJAT-29953]